MYGCGDVGEHMRELWVVPGENWDGEGGVECTGGEHDGGSVRGLADDRIQPDPPTNNNDAYTSLTLGRLTRLFMPITKHLFVWGGIGTMMVENIIEN